MPVAKIEVSMLIDAVNDDISEQMSLSTIEPFLNVVKAYCELLNSTGNTASTFRSPELEANARKTFPESCHSQYSHAMLQQLDELHAKRKLIIKNRKAHSQDTLDESGRLLMVNWRESLFDGACSPITHGFLDDDCMPGWDTWLRIASLDDSQDAHGLVCWIPTELVPLVNDAILIDAARCMSWLKQDSKDLLTAVGWGKPL
jgi:hypothetical protein